MKFLSVFLFSLIFCQFCDAFTSKSLKVRIDDGKIIGRFMRSTSGKPIRAFMGIPYAAPPIGKFRFKAPQPVERWFHNILYAHEEPPMCSQVNSFAMSKSDMKFEGQEDCLYLNVYTPEIKDRKSKKLPVMVWFHGGGWIMGHAGYTQYSPKHFLDHDIVLVTGNYRLGPLGFLSTEDENSSGNFGLKDQMTILEWVQQNIEKFHGDGHSVTIFGESAGGASVNYHMMSPISRGLFHRAISQSGTLMNQWSDPARKGLAKMRTIRLADMVGCPISGTTMKKLIECLREVSAEKITMAMLNFHEVDNDPMIPFPPVVEDFHLEEEEPFIVDLRYRKHAFDIPWLVGITSEEGLFKSLTYFLNKNKAKLQLLSKDWEKILPLIFYYDHLPEDDILEINVKIYDFYFKEDYLGATEANLTHMFSDGLFSGIFDSLEYRLRHNNRENTFVYLFSHKGAASYTELEGGGEKFLGTEHADDLLQLFPHTDTEKAFYTALPDEDDEILRKSMVKLWVNFATTGTPTPNWSKNEEFPYWTPANKFPLDYMLIGNENGNSKKLFEMKKGLLSKRAKFWMDLKKKYEMKVWKTEAAKDEQMSKDEL